MMLSEVPHPQFLEMLKVSDAELMAVPFKELEARLAAAATFQEEGLWTDEMMAYILEQGEENYIHLHWEAEQYYAAQLKREGITPSEMDYYYLVGYARIVALVLRYHDNMGYDNNDFYFIRGLLNHHFGDNKDISILEIGAGSGKLLRDLGKAGYTNVEGMEMAPAALIEARANVDGVLPVDCIHPVSFQ
ncbi:MAG: hypothetical protein AAF125_14000, partial [Chloroflexota bacterium]